jgi:hypothetical protein
MSGPQGSDPNQQWPGQQGQQPSQEDPSSGQQSAWQPPNQGSDQPTEAPSWQPPAYTPQQYPQYPQPGQQPPYTPPQQYAPTEQFGQQPGYNPSAYPQTAQYGQYGQQPGQYPQQPDQYGQQPGQYPPQYYQQPGSDEGSKKSLALVGGIVGLLAAIIVAAVLVMGFWKPGFFVTTKLDINSAQSGVQQILTDESNGYGAKNVKDVKCNDGQNPEVKQGGTFDCEVSIDGTKRQVTVTFQDDDGTYEVGRPK